MSEPLTTERFEQFVDLFTEKHGETVKRLDKIDERLERIEHILWDGARLAEIERRVIKIAETVGLPDLATPISRPIGS